MITRTRSSRGFTLVETLIAMVLLGLVSVVIYKMLITTQRVTDAQAERGDLQVNLRAGVLVIPNELRQITIGTSTTLDTVSDIRAVTDSSITYRAMRGFYTICSTPASATTLTVTNAAGFSSEYRTPTTSDSAFVLWEGDTTKTSDDAWVQVGLAGVVSTTCVYAGATRSAYTFAFTGSGIPALAFPFTKIQPGSPVRTYETVQLSLYASGGQNWLGMQVGSGTMQPVAGPLAATSGGLYGFQLTYYDSTGTALTATASNVPKIRTIKIALRGITNDQVALAGKTRSTIHDSLVTYVTLRNAPFN
ncbi:MAG: prepilin-type N-terminal cleavage/methylation domain-containing protein [Gemmatimonadales bacterium]